MTDDDTPLDVLDVSTTDAIAALCSRALDRPPAADELAACLFAEEQPTIVRGAPDVGIVASVASETGGYVRLLVVDPGHQGRGHGSRLLRAAEDDIVAEHVQPGPVVITIGADPPYYLFAGVETTQTAMLCLLESRRYARQEANFNMDVDLTTIPPDPGGWEAAGNAPDQREELEAFMVAQWENWRLEALRAFDKGTLVLGRDDEGITGFCAWDVNRRGLVGPVAVRLSLIGKGAGVPLLLGALHLIRASGRQRTEVSWVGPIVPYAAVGATVGRVFFVYRKTLSV